MLNVARRYDTRTNAKRVGIEMSMQVEPGGLNAGPCQAEARKGIPQRYSHNGSTPNVMRDFWQEGEDE